VWTCDDVTEARKSSEQLERVLAEQQALLNNVVVGIAFSRHRTIARCNRRFEELFGYAPAAAIGASFRDVYFTEDEFERRADLYGPLDEGRTHSREAWMRKQDGSGFWCRVSARAVEPGDPSRGYVFLFEDISERKRSDEVLHRLLREQDALLENALAGIIFVRDRRIVRCNRRFEELFGYLPGELIGQSTRFMFRNEAEERIERALAEQELILDNATVGIAFVRNRIIQRTNRFLEEMVGADPGELVGESSAALFADDDDWQRAGSLAFLTTAPGGNHDAEWRFKRRDGSTFRCRTRGRRIDMGD